MYTEKTIENDSDRINAEYCGAVENYSSEMRREETGIWNELQLNFTWNVSQE